MLMYTPVFLSGIALGACVGYVLALVRRAPVVPEAVPLVEVPKAADEATGPRWLQEMGIRWER